MFHHYNHAHLKPNKKITSTDIYLKKIHSLDLTGSVTDPYYPKRHGYPFSLCRSCSHFSQGFGPKIADLRIFVRSRGVGRNMISTEATNEFETSDFMWWCEKKLDYVMMWEKSDLCDDVRKNLVYVILCDDVIQIWCMWWFGNNVDTWFWEKDGPFW